MATSKTDLIRHWALERKFSRTIKSILGNYFITQDITEDMTAATDFMILLVKPFRVAVRLRRYKYFTKYRFQFTIRYSRPSGAKTELAKIYEGKVDYLLYGFVDKKEAKIIQYFIGDLDVFRELKPQPIAIRKNKSGDSELAAFSLNQLGEDFVLKFWRRRNDQQGSQHD